ncbi:MAG: hypothetical protein VKP72_01895 [bacterium]|nr:hypothetical protein [bacterium]
MAGRVQVVPGRTDPGSPGGVGQIFRSDTVANILMYFASRGITRMPVADLERELEQHAGLSRGAVENALQALVKANLLGISVSGRMRVCELRRTSIWAKLGEVFELERAETKVGSTGMPWLANLVASLPRRDGFPVRPREPEPQVSLEDTEAMLALQPVVEQPVARRRSPAPGRRS